MPDTLLSLRLHADGVDLAEPHAWATTAPADTSGGDRLHIGLHSNEPPSALDWVGK